LEHFISAYGVWLVGAFIALESIGLPLPAEASLMAAAVFAGTTHELNIWFLIPVGILCAILGNLVGYWIGRRFGYQLLTQYGDHVRLTKGRISIGQYLFIRHGGKLVFAARFLPVLRNMAAILAGMNCMPQHRFYLASGMAAAGWVTFHGLTAYLFGEAYIHLATPAAIALSVAAVLAVAAVPVLILRYETSLQAKADRALADRVAISATQ
jgi:membrane protein DedA with SNARE-associated domain